MATTVWESVVPATMCTGVDTVALSPGWQMVTDGFTELSVQLPPLVEPVPLRVTVCGLLAAESVMVRVPLRSEERRVGKECRTRVLPEQLREMRRLIYCKV